MIKKIPFVYWYIGFLAILIGGVVFFSSPADAQAARIDVDIQPDGDVNNPPSGSYGVYYYADYPDLTPQVLCGSGSSLTPGTNINIWFGVFNNCDDYLGQIVYMEISAGGNYDYVVGTAGGADWSRVSEYPPSQLTQTQVLAINTPLLYATTTAAVPVSFDFVVNASSSPDTDGYVALFVHDNSGFEVQELGLLPAYTPGVYVEHSFTSSALPYEGSWTLYMYLAGGVADKIAQPSLPLYTNGFRTATYFGVEYNDSQHNYTTPAYGGPQFASTTCAINFLGSFNPGDCIGYLTQPASSTVANFKALTLDGHFPFAYAYDVGRMRDNLLSGGSGTTTVSVNITGFGTITFLSRSMIAAVPFAPTIKVILAALMWLLTIEVIYLTVIRSHNQNTGV